MTAQAKAARILNTRTIEGLAVSSSNEQDALILKWFRRGGFMGGYIMSLKTGEAAIAKRMVKAGLCVTKVMGDSNVGWGPSALTWVRFTPEGAALCRSITKRRSIVAQDRFPSDD